MATRTGSAQVRRHTAERFDSGRDHLSIVPEFSPTDVDAALKDLPSHGWTAGWTGRRDRALLVLSHLAGLSYDNIATLRVADVTISEGVATIRTPGGTTTLPMADTSLLCGPCALARWLHAVDMTVVYPNGRVVAAVIARSVPVTSSSPHLCQGTVVTTEPTGRLMLMAGSDQRGLCGTGDISAPAAAPQTPPAAGTARRIPMQRAAAGVEFADHLGPAPVHSDHRAGPDDLSARFDQLAVGLEGRTRLLLGHGAIDVAVG